MIKWQEKFDKYKTKTTYNKKELIKFLKYKNFNHSLLDLTKPQLIEILKSIDNPRNIFYIELLCNDYITVNELKQYLEWNGKKKKVTDFN